MAKTTRTKKTEPVLTESGNGILEQKGITVQGGEIVPEQPPVNIHEEKQNEDPKPAPPSGDIPATPVVTQEVVKTYEIVEAKLKKELTRLKYNEALQALISYKVTEDNMNEAQEKLKKARGFLRQFEAIKKGIKEEALRECNWIDQAYNSLKDPLGAEILKKQGDLNKIAQDQAAKAEKARKEEQRKADIRTAIDNFIIQQSQAIAGAKTDDELVYIQKVLGSAKGNKSRYEEFLPDLIQRCNQLDPLINTQKDAIRQLRKLEEEKKKAEKAGDDAALIAIEDKKETLNATVEEQKVLVQEKAISQAIKPASVEVGRPVFNTVKARRTKWKAELKTDDKSLKTALAAGLLKCALDADRLDLLIDTLQKTNQLDGKEEFEINGIRLYLEKLY